MAQLNDILIELLKENQVLILPGFGAFTIQKESAQHKVYSHYFIPPSAKISFNSKIQRDNNDLALELAGRKNIPFTTALELVNTLVAELKSDLAKNKQTTLEGIGTLTLTTTNKLVFTQAKTNELLDDSFGLSAFHKLPIPVAKAESATAKEIRLPAALKYGLTGAAAALLGFSLSFLPFSNSTVPAQKASLVQSEDSNPVVETKEVENTENKIKANTTPSTPAETLTQEPETATIEDVSTENVAATQNYHVIVGCFSNERNAQKIIDSLAKFSYSAKILDEKNGLYRVSVPFESAVIAENELLAIRANVVKQAWLLKL